MNNFDAFITPAKAAQFAKRNGDKRPTAQIVAQFERQARDTSTCSNCDEMVWRYGGLGLCFTCTTGEADASEDFELELTAEVVAELERRAPAPPLWTKPGRIPCPICNRMIAKCGMQAHHQAKHGDQREVSAIADDANREMLGSDADYFGLGDIGNK